MAKKKAKKKVARDWAHVFRLLYDQAEGFA
jgi:hypothetical protein